MRRGRRFCPKLVQSAEVGEEGNKTVRTSALVEDKNTNVAGLRLNARNGQRTLLLLHLVAVLAINVRSLDLRLQRTRRELVHRVCDVTLELTVDDGCVVV